MSVGQKSGDVRDGEKSRTFSFLFPRIETRPLYYWRITIMTVRVDDRLPPRRSILTNFRRLLQSGQVETPPPSSPSHSLPADD